MTGTWLAGVDGCPAGWIAALVRSGSVEVRVRIVERFAEIAAMPEAPADHAARTRGRNRVR